MKLEKKHALVILMIVSLAVILVLNLLYLSKPVQRNVYYKDGIKLPHGYYARIVSRNDTEIAFIIVYQEPRPCFSEVYNHSNNEFFILTQYERVSPKLGDIFLITNIGGINLLANIKTSNSDADVVNLLEKLVVNL